MSGRTGGRTRPVTSPRCTRRAGCTHGRTARTRLGASLQQLGLVVGYPYTDGRVADLGKCRLQFGGLGIVRAGVDDEGDVPAGEPEPGDRSGLKLYLQLAIIVAPLERKTAFKANSIQEAREDELQSHIVRSSQLLEVLFRFLLSPGDIGVASPSDAGTFESQPATTPCIGSDWTCSITRRPRRSPRQHRCHRRSCHRVRGRSPHTCHSRRGGSSERALRHHRRCCRPPYSRCLDHPHRSVHTLSPRCCTPTTTEYLVSFSRCPRRCYRPPCSTCLVPRRRTGHIQRYTHPASTR